MQRAAAGMLRARGDPVGVEGFEIILEHDHLGATKCAYMYMGNWMTTTSLTDKLCIRFKEAYIALQIPSPK